jgi:hypothetical protein
MTLERINLLQLLRNKKYFADGDEFAAAMIREETVREIVTAMKESFPQSQIPMWVESKFSDYSFHRYCSSRKEQKSLSPDNE